MFGKYHNHAAIRKYIIMFGSMFNDIDVVRFNTSGAAVQSIRVPIAYGPKEKFLARLNQDPSLNKPIATQLPRLAFEITDMTYAGQRGLNKLQRNSTTSTNNNSSVSQFTPVPYDINITLYGMFANNEDAVQVVEQILPYFRPEYTHSLKLVPETGHYYDIPTVLQGMSIEDTYEGDFQTRRAIIYSFNFTVKGYIFGPVSTKGVIKRSIVDIGIPSETFVPNPAVDPQSRTTLTPGLLPDGTATANSSASVAISTITSDNNFGFAFDKEDFFSS
jgi:hypothetical protein